VWNLEAINLRDFALDKHKSVDDEPYGGGTGMVMRADVVGRGVEECFVPTGRPIIYPSPRGEVFTQAQAIEFSQGEGINILCGRFEGVDERVLSYYNVREVSLGDFVLSAGDVAAIAIIDACVRLLPGVIADPKAVEEESFGVAGEYQYLLEYPHYTRPAVWQGMSVPEVLRSGDHAKIEDWRLKQAQEKTQQVRPDIWQKYKAKRSDQC
jgi:tRNA (guanine37-N1)-methyltransferase